MGEIADALRRARESRSLDDPGARSRAPAYEAPEPHAPPRHDPTLATPTGTLSSPAAWNAAAAEPDVAESELVTLDASHAALLVEDSPGLEACRRLAVRMLDAMERRKVRSVAVVSSTRGEGKTTLACNLALALASLSAGRDVALVDLDLRKPSLARSFGVSPKIGIEQILRGAACLEESRISVARPPLDLYPVVDPQRAAHELLVTGAFKEVLLQLEQRYAVVLFDTAPTLAVPDVSLMLKHVGACVPVARIGVTRTRLLRQLMDTLPSQKVLGPVLNGARLSPDMAYYYAEEEPPVAESRTPRASWRRTGKDHPKEQGR